MDSSAKEKAKLAAQAAASVARALLSASEDIPYFGTVAKLVNKLISIIDQFKHNKKAGRELQVRFSRLAQHLFDGPTGLAAVAQSRPNNTSVAGYCARMQGILNEGNNELEKFTKKGFVLSLLKGSKPQELFDGLDRDMTQCLNELSVALNLTQLTEQAQTYEVVCNIQASIDQHGGLQGLMADQLQMQRLASLIGADIDDLGSEVQSALDSLSDQVTVVDENVRGMMVVMHEVQEAVSEIQNSAKAVGVPLPPLTYPVIVDRTQLLGVGAFGKVYKGTYGHWSVAVKEFTATGSLNAAQLKVLSREVLMHSKLSTLPGVVRLFGANLTLEPRCIVLELADGSLHDALHKKSLGVELSLSTKLSLAAQLCSAMAAISDLNILHRDIKSSNVLLFLHNGRLLAKLSDFGLTKVLNGTSVSTDGPDKPKGTHPYMAPELFRGVYSSASDMYAFAVLLNELMSEQVPFPDCSYVQIVQSVGTFRKRPVEFKADAGDEMGRELVRLIARCWHQDPALRMSFHELGAELTHLLRKTVEHAQQGDSAAPLTPPPPLSNVESAITELSGWLTSCCHIDEPDAMALAHALVTVKRITSQEVLAQVLHRSPDYLNKEMHQSVVLEAKVCSTLNIRSLTPPPASAPTSTIKLESLSRDQVCALFEYCHISDLTEFVISNKLSGADLHSGVESADDLVELGLNRIKARTLFNKISGWKANGLPSDFVASMAIAPEPGPHTAPSPEPDLFLPQVPENATASASTELQQAADEGDAVAQNRLGDCLYRGDGVEVDYAEAAKYYELAADQGHADAQCRVGICYYEGKGVSRDYSVAVKYLRVAADLGVVEAQNMLGNCYYYGRGVSVDYSAAVKYFTVAADLGLADALTSLGTCYYEGKGVEVDYATAIRYFEAAVDKKHADAQNNLGRCYYYGKGVEVDYVTAVLYFQLAVDQGNTAAHTSMGNCFLNGKGVDLDCALAVKYYYLAADQGHADAHYILAECYEKGVGVVIDQAVAVHHYKLAAHQGNEAAQYRLGRIYDNGEGVTVDYVAAATYYKLSADAGNAAAQYMLGECYYLAKGVSVDYAEAVRYYRLAADQGIAGAQNGIGMCYYDGKGESVNYLSAVKYYELAADQGNTSAQYMLGNCYYDGKGVTVDYAEAVKYYKLAADQGSAAAQYSLGNCFFNGKGVSVDYAEAFQYFTLAADQGNANAQCELGNCYYNGQGVRVDYAEALKYYKLAADQGHAGAQFKLGNCYYNGKGVSVDYTEAVKYYQLAADLGNADATTMLGECYYHSKGVSVDYATAVKYYELAADQGHADAQNILGECYYHGKGVSVDYAEAVKYYKLAADAGNADAQYHVGSCYEKGDGVSVDYAMAVQYYQLAADQGNTGAQYMLGNCYYHGNGVSVDYAEAVMYYKLAADQDNAEAQSSLGYCYYRGKGASVDKALGLKYWKLAADRGHAGAKVRLDLYEYVIRHV